MTVPISLLVAVHTSIYGGNESGLFESAQTILRKGFLRRTKPTVLEFESELTQKTVYQMMLVSTRERVHTQVVDELELNQESENALIVKHARGSGDLPRLRHYLIKAGTEARRKGADEDAVYFLSQVVDLDEHMGNRWWKASDSKRKTYEHDKGEVFLMLGMSLYGTARMVTARETMARGLKLLGMPVPSHSVSTMASIGSWAVSNIMMGRKRKVSWKKWEAKFGSGPELQGLIQAMISSYAALAQVHILQNDPPTMFIYSVFQMHTVATSIGDAPAICYACSWLTTAFVISGMPEVAERFAREAAEHADQLPIDSCVAHASYAKMWLYAGAGRMKDATYEGIKSRDGYEALGDLRRWRETSIIVCGFLDELGRLEELRETSALIDAAAKKNNDLEVQFAAQIYIGEHHVLRGDIEAGLEVFGRSTGTRREYLDRDGRADELFDKTPMWALALALNGDWNDAYEVFQGSFVGGVDTLCKYTWDAASVRYLVLGLWELDNHNRSRGVEVRSLSALEECRRILKTRAKTCAKRYELAKPVQDLYRFLDSFGNFAGDYAQMEAWAREAQLTEVTTQVALTKFYHALAVAACGERKERGLEGGGGRESWQALV